jgi:hypothetical protein
MRTPLLFAGLLLAATLTFELPAAAGLSHEDAMESVSSEIVLPAAVPGGMLAKSCASCPTRSLQLTGATQFLVGTQLVSLAELRRQFSSARYPVLVTLQPDSSIVARIVITGAAYAQ